MNDEELKLAQQKRYNGKILRKMFMRYMTDKDVVGGYALRHIVTRPYGIHIRDGWIYDEAFSKLHEELKLPDFHMNE